MGARVDHERFKAMAAKLAKNTNSEKGLSTLAQQLINRQL